MKKLFYLLLIALPLIAGCNAAKNKLEKGELLMDVSATPGLCHTWYSPEPIGCLRVRIVGQDTAFTNILPGMIQGFEYVQGYNWQLKVRKDSIENPPADAPSFVYRLIEVVSKQPE